VANPANTNALILAENAPSIPRENITALTRLDHNRVLGQVIPFTPTPPLPGRDSEITPGPQFPGAQNAQVQCSSTCEQLHICWWFQAMRRHSLMNAT